MFQFCKENIQNIVSKLISKAGVDNTRVILNERFEGVTQIPGTRSFYEFSPIDQNSIEMKIKSRDKKPFMHPSSPSRSFQWPHVDDICWVPNDHILWKIDIPITLSGISGIFRKGGMPKMEGYF